MTISFVDLDHLKTGEDCNCNNEDHGKLVSAFFHGSQMLWWMSEEQENIYCSKFPFLREKSSVVLSSVFDDGFFASVKLLNDKFKEEEVISLNPNLVYNFTAGKFLTPVSTVNIYLLYFSNMNLRFNLPESMALV